MSYFRPSNFLRRVLLIDAVTSGAMGLMAIAGAALLAPPLGLPSGLIMTAGISLMPFAALVGFIASRETLPRLAIWALIVLNGLWVVESLVLLVGGSVTPTLLGEAFIVVQALSVAVLAELEFVGLKRSVAATV